MGQILLVRHGQASFGSDDYDALSPTGFAQAQALGEDLAARGIRVDAVVHGKMRRHRETAETCASAAGWNMPGQVDEGWNEFDFQSVLAKHSHDYGPEPTKPQFQTLFEEATEAWTEGADRGYEETFAAFVQRVQLALSRTVDLASSAGTVAVFTSGGPIGVAVAATLVEPVDSDAQLAKLWTRLNRMTVNAALTHMIAGRSGVNLLTYNAQAHLGSLVTYR